MAKTPPEDDRLTVAELATRCKVSPKTVRNWWRLGVYGILLRSEFSGLKRFIRWSDYKAWQAMVDAKRTGGRVVREVEVEV